MSFILDSSAKTNWKFIGIVALLTVLVGGGVFVLSMQKEVSPQTPEVKKPDAITEKVLPEESPFISEGTLQIREEESLTFPSGAILKLENSILYFSNNVDVPRDERFTFNKKIAAYVNGYSHALEDVNCEEETRFFGDYYDSVVTQCSMQSSILRDEKPSLSSYDGVLVDFASVASKSVSRFRTLQEEPWIAVSVPYFQIAKGSTGSVVNVVSPREDIVGIYTNYGRAGFRFEAGELDNLQQKAVKVGPLTINLVPLELTCAGTYKLSDGSCYVLKWEGKSTATYNVVNFRITIEEESSSVDYPLLIDIEK